MASRGDRTLAEVGRQYALGAKLINAPDSKSGPEPGLQVRTLPSALKGTRFAEKMSSLRIHIRDLAFLGEA